MKSQPPLTGRGVDRRSMAQGATLVERFLFYRTSVTKKKILPLSRYCKLRLRSQYGTPNLLHLRPKLFIRYPSRLLQPEMV